VKGENTATTGPAKRLGKATMGKQMLDESHEVDFPKKKKKKVSLQPTAVGFNSFLSPQQASSSSQGSNFMLDIAAARSAASSATNMAHFFSSSKRPRGRPPLSGKKVNSAVVVRPLQSIPIKMEVVDLPPPAPMKASPRPPFKIVTKKVCAKLMISDPVTLDDLCKRIPECPRDMVATVLEVLCALGLVEQRDGRATVFSLLDFTKIPTAVPLDKLEDEITKKAEDSSRIHLRMEQINVSDIPYC
jgi:hypothetical protein